MGSFLTASNAWLKTGGKAERYTYGTVQGCWRPGYSVDGQITDSKPFLGIAGRRISALIPIGHVPIKSHVAHPSEHRIWETTPPKTANPPVPCPAQ